MAKPKVPTDPKMSPEVRSFLEDLQAQTDDLPTTTQTEYLSGVIKTPADQDYRVVEKIPYAATLTGFATKTSAGTLTATLKINTTAVTNGAASVTSTQGEVTPTAANVMTADDTLVITVSSVSSAANFSFTISYTRTLD